MDFALTNVCRVLEPKAVNSNACSGVVGYIIAVMFANYQQT